MQRDGQTAGPRGLTYGLLFAAALWGAILALVAFVRR
jgi:hypothetical protein